MTFNFGQLPGYQPASENLIFEGVVIGSICTTPLGYKHVEIESEFANQSIVDFVTRQTQPTTLAVNEPNKDQFSTLKNDGFHLRSEIVRWLAPIGPIERPWKNLSTKRAKKNTCQYSKSSSTYKNCQRTPHD